MDRRVVISGIGMVTPLGIEKDIVFQRLINGISGIGNISLFDTCRFYSHLGAEVSDITHREFVSVKNRRKMDRLSIMAAASARMAVEDAKIKIDMLNKERIGIILGSAYGNTEVAARFGRILFTEGPNMVNPILVPNTVINAPAGHTAIELGLKGINSTINHREASAEIAIAYAFDTIRRGNADIMLAGGADIISEFFFEVMANFNALSPKGAYPFDIMRNGMILGEGAGIICLEDLDHAKNRGITPYCEIAGAGMSSYPSSPSDWDSNIKGPVLAITRASDSAKIKPENIDYISASANGGIKLDALEAAALLEIFGKQKPLISSVKGALGESSSSGGIRAAIMAMSIKENLIPPTLGLKNPINSLLFVMQKKETRIDYGLINGFASGGTFACVIMKKIE